MHCPLSNLIAAAAHLVPTPFRNSNCSSLRYALALVSILLITMPIINFMPSTIRLMVLCYSYLVVCDFFLICMSTDCSYSSGHTPVLCIVQHSSTNLSTQIVLIVFHISAEIDHLFVPTCNLLDGV